MSDKQHSRHREQRSRDHFFSWDGLELKTFIRIFILLQFVCDLLTIRLVTYLYSSTNLYSYLEKLNEQYQLNVSSTDTITYLISLFGDLVYTLCALIFIINLVHFYGIYRLKKWSRPYLYIYNFLMFIFHLVISYQVRDRNLVLVIGGFIISLSYFYNWLGFKYFKLHQFAKAI